MIFLCLALIYMSGVMSFVGLRRQSSFSRHWSTYFIYANGAMIMTLSLIGLVYVGLAQILGVLRVIRIMLYHVIVVQPLFLVTIVWLVRRDATRKLSEASRVSKLHSAVIMLGALLALWSTQIEPYWLEVVHTTHKLPEARAGKAPLRVAVLADLQNDTITPHQHSVIDALLAESPDLILIPGDLYDSQAAHAHVEDFRDLLARLHAPGGVFMVVGDHDSIPMLTTMIQGTEVVLLDDRTVQLEIKDRRVELLGLSLPTRPSYDAALASEARDQGLIRLVLVHRPRLVQALTPGDGVDLVVAGHTHGGQINVPFFGPPVTISPLPRDVAAGGLHRVDGTPLYISRGVGGVQFALPLIRFNCRPEVSIITLQ